MNPVSPLRLNLLRACYALLVVGLSWQFGLQLFTDAANMPLMDGVVTALLSALGVCAILGLIRPIKFLPLLVFEVAWKAIWCLAIALPRWLNNELDAATIEVLIACAWVVPFLFIIPWRWVFNLNAQSAEN